jgi:hypothetical protein
MLTLKEPKIAEGAKTKIYGLYINEADIYYEPLYDRVMK